MDKTSRSVVKGHLIAGMLFILLGFGQFFVSFWLDALGVIEIGNALGLALLVYLAVAIGLVFFFLALILALLTARR